MMQKFLSKKLMIAPLVAGSLLCLASCGGEGDLEVGGTTDMATVQALLPTFNSMISSFRLSDSGTVGLPSTITLPGGVGVFAETGPDFSGCKKETGSKTEDGDNDGIPRNFRQDFDCSNIANGTGKSTQVGHYEVTDKDDTKFGVLGGFKFDFDIAYNDEFAHETNKGGFKGTYEATIAGNALTLDSFFNYEGGSVPTDGQPSSYWKSRNEYTTTYTPEDMLAPWTKGKFKIDGKTGYSGTIYVQQTKTEVPFDFVFKINADIEYDKACGSYYTNGTFRFTDGSNNVFEYKYAGCGNQSITFNGQPVQVN